MASVLPPPAKRQRREYLERSKTQQDVTPKSKPDGVFHAHFVDPEGNQLGDNVAIPFSHGSEKDVSQALNLLLEREPGEFLPYKFRVHIPDTDVIVHQYPEDLHALLESHGVSSESVITFTAEPQSIFRVQTVTRAASRMPGHGGNVLAARFSPKTGSLLATGSGDNTARIWDTDTGTPRHKLVGHTNHVLVVSWSPDGERLATGSKDHTVRLWDPKTGNPAAAPFRGHAQFISSLAWEPYHLWRDGTTRLASASKDSTVRIWIVNTGVTEHVLSGHKGIIRCVKWGGTNQIYTASGDKTVRVWDAARGTLIHSFTSHSHGVNHVALSTDFALRTAFYDHEQVPRTEEERRKKAKERFERAGRVGGQVSERLVTASDDFTMYLWEPSKGTKPIARLHGHQKQVMDVSFSPDGSIIASTGFDNQTKIWNARDGKFINTLRGHVAPVYQCAFSADSRLLVTGSKDTTLKVWSMATFQLVSDLPGHQDEVYAVDWSPDGQLVASGGKDKAIRLWRH